MRTLILTAMTAAIATTPLCAQTAHTSHNSAIQVGPNVRVSAAHPDEAHYEVHAAAHPTDASKILITGIIYPVNERRGTIVYISSDGGKTWTPSFEGPELENTGDPAVAYGPDGTGYFAILTSRGHPLEVKPEKPAHNWDGRKTMLYRLPKDSSRWIGPATFLFADREYITVDDTGGKYDGRVYVSGDPRPNSGFVLFSSTDGGRSFPQVQGAEADTRGASIGNAVVASDGTVIGAYADPGHVRAVRSIDGGKTLLPSVVVDTFVRAGSRKDPKHHNVNHFMTVAIDRSAGAHNDRVYVTWPDRRAGYSQVWFAYSDDKGQTWSKARVVTDNPANDTNDQFMPTVAVNNQGIVGLLWYDRRDNPDNLSYYARFSASRDGGVTWLPSVRVSTDPYVSGPVSKKSAFPGNGGDTAGLATAADATFHPAWIDDRTGVPQIWTATVRVEP